MEDLANQQPTSDVGEEQSVQNIAAALRSLQTEMDTLKDKLNVVEKQNAELTQRVKQLETFGVKYGEMGGETYLYLDLERLYDPIMESLGDDEVAKKDFEEYVSDRRKERLKRSGGLCASVGGVAFIAHIACCGGIAGSFASLGIGAAVTAVVIFGIWAYRNREWWMPKVASVVKRIKEKFRDEFSLVERLITKQD